MHANLSSGHYRRSPLVQRGLETPSTVLLSIPSTLTNEQLAGWYLQVVKERYSDPANEKIGGSFITKAFPEPSTSRIEGRRKVYNGAKKKQKDSQWIWDIGEIFQAVARKKLKKNTDVIKLD